MRTIIAATSDWSGVQPTRFAFGWAATGAPVVEVAAVSLPVTFPVTEASVCWIQLPDGMTRDSSRIRRSQSKRVSATVLTEATRASLS